MAPSHHFPVLAGQATAGSVAPHRRPTADARLPTPSRGFNRPAARLAPDSDDQVQLETCTWAANYPLPGEPVTILESLHRLARFMLKDRGTALARGRHPVEHEPGRESWTTFLLPLALILGLGLLLSLNAGPAGGETTSISPLEPWLKLLVGYLAAGAEIAAGVVIGVAVLRSIWAYVQRLASPQPERVESTEAIRLALGRALALGLEFTVASDILRTAVAPSRQDILNLAAIVLLRTLLNYFLEREIRQVEARRGASIPATAEGEG
ncbi:MAG: DUF1622 domain-containing protein [Ardenticatenaceae bacterium]|nr:DUF1622 domain-containing protein [Ardenticatenaceae bacterium]